MVETLRFSARASMLAALTAASFAAAAAEQVPSDAQAIAIRKSCRADYEKVCAGVPTGGEPALQCLKQNILQVSQPCQAALSAVRPGANSIPSAQQQIAKAAGQPPKSTAAAQPQKSAGAPTPTGTTAGATATAGDMTTASAAKAASNPTTLPARPPENSAPSKAPLREEMMIARDVCGPEYRKFCQAVRPGGGRSIACLEANDASLTPACKKVVGEARQRM